MLYCGKTFVFVLEDIDVNGDELWNIMPSFVCSAEEIAIPDDKKQIIDEVFVEALRNIGNLFLESIKCKNNTVSFPLDRLKDTYAARKMQQLYDKLDEFRGNMASYEPAVLSEIINNTHQIYVYGRLSKTDKDAYLMTFDQWLMSNQRNKVEIKKVFRYYY